MLVTFRKTEELTVEIPEEKFMEVLENSDPWYEFDAYVSNMDVVRREARDDSGRILWLDRS